MLVGRLLVLLVGASMMAGYYGVDEFVKGKGKRLAPSAERNRHFTRSKMSSMTAAFTQYHTFFRSVNKEDVMMCFPSFALNKTFLTLEGGSVMVCPDPHFQPRRVLRSQVGWKPRSEKSEQPTNATSSTNATAASESLQPSKIHAFLAFALLLPQHPFSTEAHKALSAVGPMFPSVTVVCGDGNDFRDMVQKYFVHAFPKLLLFKSGIYTGAYDGDYTPEALAAHFAGWTQQLPSSYPLLPVAASSPPPVGWVNVMSMLAQLEVPHGVLEALPVNLTLPIPWPNLEPFVGSVRGSQRWEAIAFVACGLYSLGRVLATVRSALQPGPAPRL